MKFGLTRRAASSGFALAFSLTLAAAALGQSGYSVGEGSNSTAATPGPVRLARISYSSGTVTWRPSETVDWSNATANLPLRQGADLWSRTGSRAEVQFDDGSIMRLGADGLATLQTLYSDDKGEFTEIKLTQGLTTLHLTTKLSEYQIDTPLCSVKAFGPANLRIGVAGGVEVVVREGEAQVDTASGETTLRAGQRLKLGGTLLGGQRQHSGVTRRPGTAGSNVAQGYAPPASTQTFNGQGSSAQSYSPPVQDNTQADYTSGPVVVDSAPATDSWDTWSDERDTVCFHYNAYVPSCVNIVAGNLDIYGSWHDDPHYGHVWCPREAAQPDWRPYHSGEWAWVSPVGWTWVPSEPWGYAPCHYGTWVNEAYGWAWCPGPPQQYWSPAVVSFCDDGVGVAWVPLAPFEVRYPAAISIGFRSGDWWASFSIGQAACYYPTGDSCAPRPWSNTFINRTTNIYNFSTVDRYYGQSTTSMRNFYGVNNRFRPHNAFQANGATYASRTAFTSGGTFRSLSTRQATIFQRGRTYTDLPRGAQVSGPLGLAPHVGSAFTPSHATYAHATRPANALMQRPVFRAALPRRVASQSTVFRGRSFIPPTRPATVVRRSAVASVRPTTVSRIPSRPVISRPPNRFTTRRPAAVAGTLPKRSRPRITAPAIRRPATSRRVASRSAVAPIHRGGAAAHRVVTRRASAPIRHASAPVRRVAAPFGRPSSPVRRPASPVAHRPAFTRAPSAPIRQPGIARRPPPPATQRRSFTPPPTRPAAPRFEPPRAAPPRFVPRAAPPRPSAPRSAPPRPSAPRPGAGRGGPRRPGGHR